MAPAVRPEQRYQRALLGTSRAAARSLPERWPASRVSRPTPAPDRLKERDPSASRTRRRPCSESGSSCRVAEGVDGFFRTSTRRSTRSSTPGCSPSTRGPDLWHRHRHPGRQAVESLQRDRRASPLGWRTRGAAAFLRALFGGHDNGVTVPALFAAASQSAGRLRSMPGSSSLTRRCTTSATGRPAVCSAHRLEL